MEPESRILVVDDAPTNIRLLSQVLRSSYVVYAATDGETALELARSQQPDLILLDVLMPGMDGYEVCRRLKSDPQTRTFPVIFVTALEPEESKGAEFGATGFLTKPIDPASVLAQVAACLNKNSQ